MLRSLTSRFDTLMYQKAVNPTIQHPDMGYQHQIKFKVYLALCIVALDFLVNDDRYSQHRSIALQPV